MYLAIYSSLTEIYLTCRIAEILTIRAILFMPNDTSFLASLSSLSIETFSSSGSQQFEKPTTLSQNLFYGNFQVAFKRVRIRFLTMSTFRHPLRKELQDSCNSRISIVKLVKSPRPQICPLFSLECNPKTRSKQKTSVDSKTTLGSLDAYFHHTCFYLIDLYFLFYLQQVSPQAIHHLHLLCATTLIRLQTASTRTFQPQFHYQDSSTAFFKLPQYHCFFLQLLPHNRDNRRWHPKVCINTSHATCLRMWYVSDKFCFSIILRAAYNETRSGTLSRCASFEHVFIHDCALSFFTTIFFKISSAFVSEEVKYGP